MGCICCTLLGAILQQEQAAVQGLHMLYSATACSQHSTDAVGSQPYVYSVSRAGLRGRRWSAGYTT